MASIYRRGRYYWIKYYLHGKKVEHSLKVKDRKLAEHLRKKKEIEIEEGRTYPTSDIKWANFLTEYKTYCKTTKTPNTCNRDFNTIDQFHRWAKISKLKDINLGLLRKYINHRIENDDLNPGTINKFINVIKALLSYAVNHQYLIDNPASNLKKIKETKNPPRFLNKDQIDKLLESAEGSRLYPMIATAIYTGLRLSELLYLEWDDFDFEKELLTVENKHEHNYKTKSKKFRIVPLNKKLISILEPYKKEKGWCFPTPRQERYIQRPRQLFEAIIKKAELKNVGWHTLRHTFASQLAQAGVSIYKISQWLGHSSVNTTMIYAHLAPQKDEDINKF